MLFALFYILKKVWKQSNLLTELAYSKEECGGQICLPPQSVSAQPLGTIAGCNIRFSYLKKYSLKSVEFYIKTLKYEEDTADLKCCQVVLSPFFHIREQWVLSLVPD